MLQPADAQNKDWGPLPVLRVVVGCPALSSLCNSLTAHVLAKLPDLCSALRHGCRLLLQPLLQGGHSGRRILPHRRLLGST